MRILRPASLFLIAVTLLPLIHAESARKPRPWPEINLSLLPTVVGMSNSWPYEINERSAVYLSDLDKLHIALSYGFGRNDNELRTLSGDAASRFGYGFYKSIDYKISDIKLDVYSHLGKKTFASLWAVYGEDKNRKDNNAFLVYEPNRVEVRTSFAWRFRQDWTGAIAGSFSNYPYAYVFSLQPEGTRPADPQFELPANVGEHFTATIDLMRRTKKFDWIVGFNMERHYSKFAAPDPPAGSNYRDTSEVKEFIYSGAPRLIVKRSFPSGSYLRAGAAVYFNLFDYQYTGAGRWDYPSTSVPSYRSQTINTMIPTYKIFIDGSRVLNANAVLYSTLEFAGYPNRLTRKDTDFVPINLSLVDAEDIFTANWATDIAANLTRIFTGLIGVRARYVNGEAPPADELDLRPLDDRSLYVSLRLGAQTRFYRNLWLNVRVNDLRLYTSEEVGSAALFENRRYVETELLFLGL